MALQLTVNTDSGFTAQDAYHRVSNVFLLDKENISFNLVSYKTPDLPAFKTVGYQCAYDLNGSNPIKQAYEHLKTLPEFAGAIDC
jgi:hypothetical protein